MIFTQPGQEIPDACGFNIIISCGADKVGEFFGLHAVHFFGCKRGCGFEIGYGFFHVGPVSILGKYGAYDYFKGCLAWPPVLGAKVRKKQTVNFIQSPGCHKGNRYFQKTRFFGIVICEYNLYTFAKSQLRV